MMGKNFLLQIRFDNLLLNLPIEKKNVNYTLLMCSWVRGHSKKYYETA